MPSPDLAAIFDLCKLKIPSQGFLSGNQAKFALRIHVKPSKKQYTSHNNMVHYITDRGGNWTIMQKHH